MSNIQKKAYTSKEILTIAYPILISLVMEQAIGMTDTAFLGRVGEVELGASAIAGVYYIAIFMIGFGFSIGSQILMARRNGEKRYSEIGDIFYQGVYFMIFLAAVAFALTEVITPWLLPKILSSQNIYAAAESYIHWRAFGFFFSFVAVMFRAFFVGTTQTKTLTLNSLVMVGSNIVFNYILIFGKLGFPALGIAGAAIGSSLAELVSLIFFIIYTVRKIDLKKYGLNRFSSFNMDKLRRILNVSLWTMIQNFVSLSTWFIFFLYVEHLGERPLAITNIIRNISGITFMIISAFASTCGSLVSNQIGAGKADSVVCTVHQHIKLALAIVLPLTVLFAVFPTGVLGIYTDMPERSVNPVVVGVLYHYMAYGCIEYLFSIGIGYGKYANGIYIGIVHPRDLCRIYHCYNSDNEARCGVVLDFGTCLRRIPAYLLQYISSPRKMEIEEDIGPLRSYFSLERKRSLSTM